MEQVNRRDLPDVFPFALFAALWLSGLIFVVAAALTGRNLVAGDAARRPVQVILGTVVALSMGVFWAVLFLDQQPCFLGVPNCD
ncbi:MAG TPA: hypothetical protein VNA17_05685 [Pyrinomonadaceae bacterium]|nr:hypothetical protein [Pyrinomonadaceae bacterium]